MCKIGQYVNFDLKALILELCVEDAVAGTAAWHASTGVAPTACILLRQLILSDVAGTVARIAYDVF